MTVPLATICAHIRATLPDCTPASVAAHFALSRFHLSRRFHRETGLPLRDYIAALKIEQGIAALVAQKPVIDSQLDAGHESAATYSHTFRAATGIAPAHYRDQIAAYSAALSAELARSQPRVFAHHAYSPAQHPQAHPLAVRLCGGETRHAVFAGLFPAPIPRGVPILGRALFHCREFRIDAPRRHLLPACLRNPAQPQPAALFPPRPLPARAASRARHLPTARRDTHRPCPAPLRRERPADNRQPAETALRLPAPAQSMTSRPPDAALSCRSLIHNRS